MDDFGPEGRARMAEAAKDLRYLLGRGYSAKSALTLVGDKAQLTTRQRQLLFRCVQSADDARVIRARAVAPEEVARARLLVDGYNVLITLESAVKGAPLIRSDDGFLRDVAEVHGSYRESERTAKAIALLAGAVRALAPDVVELHLDRPIAFSARTAEKLRATLRPEDQVSLADSADAAIKAALVERPDAIAATSDSAILRRAARVFDLPAYALGPEHPRLQLDADA